MPLSEKYAQLALGFLRLALSLWLCLTAMQPAQAASFQAHDIKAVFIYQFAHFVRWPDASNGSGPDTFRFCALNEDSVTASLRAIIAEQPSAITMDFEVVRDLNAALENCQILYVGRTGDSRWSQQAELNHPLLVVGDSAAPNDHELMISLDIRRDRIHPIINLDKIRQCGMSVSSKLLRLATVIGESDEG